MAVFRIQKNENYTTMSNYHLRDKNLSLKAKGLLSQMLSLPEDWDYTLKGLAHINKESVDVIRQTVQELELAGYIVRSRKRDAKGRLQGADYLIFEDPQMASEQGDSTLENPTLENPTLEKPCVGKNLCRENPTLENPYVGKSLCRENPTQEKPYVGKTLCRENPTLEKPTLENPTQLNTNRLNTDLPSTDLSIHPSIYPSIHPSIQEEGRIEEKETKIEDILRENINLDRLLQSNNPGEAEDAREIYTLLCDVLRVPRETLRIGGDDIPFDIVKERFLNLREEDVRSVCDGIRQASTPIRNVRGYLLTALYNAPITRRYIKSNEVRNKNIPKSHDFEQRDYTSEQWAAIERRMSGMERPGDAELIAGEGSRDGSFFPDPNQATGR